MQSETQSNSNNQLVVQNSGSLSFSSHLSKEDEEMSRSALSTFRAKEEEIERKKMEVREKVQLQLGRVEEETKRLATIREVCKYIISPCLYHMLWLCYVLPFSRFLPQISVSLNWETFFFYLS